MRVTLIIIILSFFVACQREQPASSSKTYILQTDWFAQPEYAGFYQALALGYYEEAGIKIEIQEGGPNTGPLNRLLTGRAHFMNARSESAIVSVARGLPVRFVGVTLQHNPEAVLSHAEQAITDFRQLDGKSIMADLSAPWIRYIQHKYDISINLLPHNFGISHYLSDQSFVMACFLTNEPYFVRQQGANPSVLPVWESGFDSYRGILVHQELVDAEPEMVKKFVEATHRGWYSYLYEDPSPAHDLIAQRNPNMTPEFMDFIFRQIQEYGLVDGRPRAAENIGAFNESRMREQIEILKNIELIGNKIEFDDVFSMVTQVD